MRPPVLYVSWLALAGACTTLGPMPATTGISAIPANRPGVELQAGGMPGYYLSDTVQEGEAGIALPQLSALVEPGRRGLVVGARQWGSEGDTPVEPFVGWRRRVAERSSVAVIGYGTLARGASSGASYSALRLGGELAGDATLIDGRKASLHLHGSLSATLLDASGTYCVTPQLEATDCDDGDRRIDATIDGIYSAATVGLALDLARRPTGHLHGVRLALLGAVGGMPRVRGGVQEPSADRYHSVGFSLTVGFGADR